MPVNRLFKRYDDLRRYVGWNDDDAQRVRAAGKLIESHFAAIVDDFYEEIERHPAAKAVIRGGAEQVERLKVTLQKWLLQLFSGIYDYEYVSRRWHVGCRHVEIGLDQVYTNVALSRIRSQIVQRLSANWNSAEGDIHRTLESVNRLIDLDLALIEDAYQFEYIQRQKRIERLVTIGQMASGIAHELRNPLNVVKTSVYFLQNAKHPSPEKQAEHFERIMRQVSVADNVIKALSDFAKLPLPEFQPFNVHDLINNTLATLDIPATIQLNVEHNDTNRIPLGDILQLSIVISNLIRNAMDAMPSGGKITVRSSEADSRFKIELIDEGTGIPTEELRQIFEPFFSKKTRGMGLGLAIVRAIVENHRGEIQVESTLGKGTKFTILLPAQRENVS